MSEEAIPYNPPGLDGYLRAKAASNQRLLDKHRKEEASKPQAISTLGSSEIFSRKRGSDGLYEPLDDSTIDDGFGSEWSAWCCMCGRKSIHVVRPGNVQCGYCG